MYQSVSDSGHDGDQNLVEGRIEVRGRQHQYFDDDASANHGQADVIPVVRNLAEIVDEPYRDIGHPLPAFSPAGRNHTPAKQPARAKTAGNPISHIPSHGGIADHVHGGG